MGESGTFLVVAFEWRNPKFIPGIREKYFTRNCY